MATVERKVLFFKMRTKDGDIEDQARSFEQTCQAIMRLRIDKRSYTLLQAGPEEYIRLMSFEKTGDFYCGHFTKYRSGNIVTGKDDNDTAEDYTLEDGRKPLEITHFIYIPKYHLLAVEYNHHGPKHSQFVTYINVLQNDAHLDGIYYIADTVFHPDALEAIKSAKEIKLVELTTSRYSIPAGKGFARLRRAFESLVDIGKPGKVTLTLRADRGDSVMSGVELVNLLTDGTGQPAELESAKARVVMEEGMEAQLVNLLQNKIDSKIKMPGADVAAKAQAIFEAMWKVYTDNRQLLLKAIDEKND